MRWLAAVMCILLVMAAAVQLNDPDPLRWMAVYSLGALASGLAFARRCPEWLAALAFGVFAVWGLSMVPAVLQFRVESVTEMSRGSIIDEEAREGLGLLIGAAWCGALWRWIRRSHRPSNPDPSKITSEQST
jgi:hypothetical protein